MSVRFSTSECPIRNYDPPLFPCASIAITHYLLDRSTHRFVKHPWNSSFFSSLSLSLSLIFPSFPLRFHNSSSSSFFFHAASRETRDDHRKFLFFATRRQVFLGVRSAVPLKLLRNYLEGGTRGSSAAKMIIVGREGGGRVVGSNEGNASFVSQRLERIDELPCSFEGRDYSF